MEIFSQKMLRTIIIDDESHIRITLARLLEKHCPKTKLIGEANSVSTGLDLIGKQNPDLVLLDVEMGDGTGFELLNLLDQIDFKLIFITAFEKYAVRAFKYSAVDFLLKPINHLELAEAVDRVSDIKQSDYNTRLKILEENLKTENSNQQKIILRTLESIYLMEIGDIVYCESDSCYTRIHTIENRNILISKPLKEYDSLLSEAGFFRCHRSYLINLKHLKRFDKTEGGSVVLTGNHIIPVSHRKKDELLELFKDMGK